MNKKGFFDGRIWAEFIVAARFFVVGFSATVTHVVSVSLLISIFMFSALKANTISFCLAFGVSFLGNYIWTFKSPGSPARALRRFLVTSVGAFLVNSTMLTCLLYIGLTSPLISALLSALAVPPLTFLASRFWAFQS